MAESAENLEIELDGKTVRFVHRLLYDYKTFDAAIRQTEAQLEDLFPGRSRSYIITGIIPSHSPVDTSETERWGIERVEGRRAARLRQQIQDKLRWKAGIEEALALADDVGRRIYQLRYAEERPHYRVAKLLDLPQRTYYRLHKSFIVLVAKCLGQA